MANGGKNLGTVDASEQLLRDLYLDLRGKLSEWAAVTHQTAQARMGYIGQHLTSVVTGYPGGRSGARGDDLVLGGGRFAEIKTCYRVDQLGSCRTCEARVAAIEDACPACGGKDIDRKDDSKWLIGLRNETEFAEVIAPASYYLVLFDFVDLNDPSQIRASIWEVDPRVPGFALCMVDYFCNIRAASKSKAPFNLWPFQLKFDLMRPRLIYRSVMIPSDGHVRTEVFPGRDDAVPHRLSPLPDYARARNLTDDAIRLSHDRLGNPVPNGGRLGGTQLLRAIEELKAGIDPDTLVDAFACGLYVEAVRPHVDNLPAVLQAAVRPFLG